MFYFSVCFLFCTLLAFACIVGLTSLSSSCILPNCGVCMVAHTYACIFVCVLLMHLFPSKCFSCIWLEKKVCLYSFAFCMPFCLYRFFPRVPYLFDILNTSTWHGHLSCALVPPCFYCTLLFLFLLIKHTPHHNAFHFVLHTSAHILLPLPCTFFSKLVSPLLGSTVLMEEANSDGRDFHFVLNKYIFTAFFHLSHIAHAHLFVLRVRMT